MAKANSSAIEVDQIPGLWAYSSLQWLRHTIPTHDKNLGRWPASPFWLAVQKADFFGEGTPAIRERKNQGNLKLICQMLAGCSTTAAAYLAGALPEWDDGANFLTWFYTWMEQYLREKGKAFDELTRWKRIRLGIVEEMTAHVA